MIFSHCKLGDVLGLNKVPNGRLPRNAASSSGQLNPAAIILGSKIKLFAHGVVCTSVLISMLLLTSVSSLWAGVNPGPNRIINMRTVQIHESLADAIDGAGEGDTLVLGCGIYNEGVFVQKSLTFEGAGECDDDGPTIDASGGTAIATINQGELRLTIRGIRFRGNVVSDANSVHVENSEFLGQGAGIGTALALVWHPGPTALKFKDNFVKGWQYAVQGADLAPGAEIRGNFLRAVSNGFYLTNAPQAKIEMNRIQNYIDVESAQSIRRFQNGIGVGLVNSPGSKVYKNTICGTHTGIRLDHGSNGSVADLNVVSGDPDALDNEYRPALLAQLRAQGVAEEQLMYEYDTLARGKGGGIIVSESDDVTVSRGRFCRGAYGVEINNARRTVVKDTVIMLMTIGIDVTPHEAPQGDPQWALRIGRNWYGGPEGINTEGVSDAIGEPRLVRRPKRVTISDHKNRIVSIAPHYQDPPVPVSQFLSLCPSIRGEAGWVPPEEFDY